MELCREGVEKCRSLLVLGYKVNIASKLVDDQLRNYKSKANAICVKLLLFILDWAKKLEQLVLILVPNSNTIIHHRQPQELVRTILNDNHDLTITISKFNRVRKKVQENLLQPLDVRFHKIVLKATNFEIFEVLRYNDCFHVYFILLDVHYFLDCLSDIKNHRVLSKILLLLVEDGVV